jgi:CheY-like chemotaxis protein
MPLGTSKVSVCPRDRGSRLPSHVASKCFKAQGWHVHGIWRTERAFHILPHIPYSLIVIDSDLLRISGIDFVRIPRDSREWREIQLVIITSSQSVAFANQTAEDGAFIARKSRWQDDHFSFLSRHDKDPTENSVNDQGV